MNLMLPVATRERLRVATSSALRLFLVSLLLLIPIAAIPEEPTPTAHSAWSSESYQKYDVASFDKFEPADAEVAGDSPDLDLLSAALFYAINRVRKEHAASSLEFVNSLAVAADLHSKDMVRYGFFAHTNSFVPERATPDLRLALSGIRSGEHAELIASGVAIRMEEGERIRRSRRKGKVFLDAATDRVIPAHTCRSLALRIVTEWLSSAADRQDLLADRFHFGGCGVAHYADENLSGLDRFKFTCLFSTRKE